MSSISIALNRFGLGARPQDSGPADAKEWLLAQMDRFQSRPDAWAAQPGTAELLARLQAIQRELRGASGEQKVALAQVQQREVRQTYVEAVRARASAALQSETPFVERLVHFWANHFAVSAEKPGVTQLAGAFECDAIRPHVLGRFENMLAAVERHPAMLLYLDQAGSIGPDSVAARRLARRDPQQRRRGLNENLAREVLELHTLGVRSGYTQDDVTEFARALTGWTVPNANGAADASGPAGYAFRPGIHEPGPRFVRGRSYSEDGEAQAAAMLHDISTAPETARHIATKLARHFVSDEPSPALVQRLARTFQDTDGDLPSVYRTLVHSRESWSGEAGKFRTPWDWTLAAGRALGWRDVAPQQFTQLMTQAGQPVWRPGSPAGWDDVTSAWLAPDALMRRIEIAGRLAARAGDTLDAQALAARVLPGTLRPGTSSALSRAESRSSSLALLLVSPEFLRR